MVVGWAVPCDCPADPVVVGPSFVGVVGGLGALLFLWWLVLLIRSLRNEELLAEWRQLKSLLLGKREEDLLDRRVGKLLRQRRLERHRKGVRWLRLFAAPVVAILAMIPSAAFLQRAILHSCLGEALLVALWSLLFEHFHRQLKLTAVDCFWGFLYAAFGLQPLLAVSDWQYFAALAICSVCQMMIAVLLADARPLAIPNLIYVAVQISFVLTSRLALRFNGAVMIILFTAILSTVSGISAREWMRLEVLAVLREGRALDNEATAKGLLSVTCDAVAKLKSDLTLSEPCPKLWALLLNTSPGSGKGQPFLGIVDPLDRQRVQLLLDEEDGPPSTLHTFLVDAVGARVPVQLFHTHSEFEGERSHILGISEQCQEGVQIQREPPPVQSGDFDSVAPLLAASQRFSSQSDGEEGNAESVINSLCSSNSSRSVIAGWEGNGLGELLLDLRLRLEMEVVGQTDGAAALFNFAFARTADHFLGCFREEDRPKLLMWLLMLHAQIEAFGKISSSDIMHGPVNLLNQHTNVEYETMLMAKYSKKDLGATKSTDAPRASGKQPIMQVSLLPPTARMKEKPKDMARRLLRERGRKAAQSQWPRAELERLELPGAVNDVGPSTIGLQPCKTSPSARSCLSTPRT